jgi:exopolyphosphatase/guanosine-5'-triphosphate,3'-diphosphate pyrophosphatase
MGSATRVSTRISTIDIGTNTILALDVEAPHGGRLVRRADHLDIVRLGEGLDGSGRLSEAAMARAIAVLERHGARIAAARPDAAAASASTAGNENPS